MKGIFPVLMGAIIGGAFTAWLGNWKQRRHDYGSLLETLATRNAAELPKRIDLAALVASRRLLPILERIRSETNGRAETEISPERWEAWRSDLFVAMRRDLNPLLRAW